MLELTLKSRGQDVVVAQSILASQGFYKGTHDGVFGPVTRDAVIRFQMAHADSQGRALTPDGVVGPATWWALQNPSGDSQREFLKRRMPRGLTEARRQLVEAAYWWHDRGTQEEPDGSNWGDGVSNILEGIGPAYWCCFFTSRVWKDFSGDWPGGKRHGHVLTFWNAFRKTHAVARPAPGDFFIMLYRENGKLTGSGHIGMVVAVSADGLTFNTIEGNAGNRVKLGTRRFDQETLVGFIRLLQDGQDDKFQRSTLQVNSMGNDNTR